MPHTSDGEPVQIHCSTSRTHDYSFVRHTGWDGSRRTSRTLNHLGTKTLEDDRRQRKITTKGIGFGRGRRYVAEWMVGRVGTAVRLRYMPHHAHEVEVFDAKSGVHLGTAVLADQAPPETVAAVRRARNRKASQLRADLAAAEKARRARYAATTTPAPARRLDTVTVAEAERELADERDQDLVRWSRPDLIPLSPPAPGWVLPVDLDRDNDEGRTRAR
jgi:putative transposase